MQNNIDDLLTKEEYKQYTHEIALLKKEYLKNHGLRTWEQYLQEKLPAIREKIKNKANNNKKQTMLIIPQYIPTSLVNDVAPLSNFIAKSSIFAPRQKSAKVKDTGQNYIDIASPSNLKIQYNGPLLDMSDQTVYLALTKFAEGSKPGEPIFLNKAELLKLCGYSSIGKSTYTKLEHSILKLSQANLKFEFKNYYINESNQLESKNNQKTTILLNLIDKVAYDSNNKIFIVLSSEILTLFSNNLFGYNNLEVRKKWRKSAVNKIELTFWLQSYICADAKGEHAPVKISTIKKLINNNSKNNDFVNAIKIAFQNLLDMKEIKDYYIYKVDKSEYMVVWNR